MTVQILETLNKYSNSEIKYRKEDNRKESKSSIIGGRYIKILCLRSYGFTTILSQFIPISPELRK